MGPPQIRALIGARVSHVQGTEKLSHIEQARTGREYADRRGWPIVGTFEDLDVSAIKTTPFDRPDLKPWLVDRFDQWDALIVAKTDRLFRSAKDCVDLAHWMEQQHKILVVADDGLVLDFFHDQKDLDPFAAMMSKIFLLLAAMFAEIEGRRFVQRAQARVRSLRHTDRWGYGVAPYGFQIVPHPSGTGKALAHEAVMQTQLHLTAERILTEPDWSWVGLVSDLNSERTLSPRDIRRVQRGEKSKGAHWTIEKLQKILTSPATQGIKVSSGRPVLDESGEPIRVGPASFAPDVWDELQKTISERTGQGHQRRHSMNPLLGVGRCELCGKSLRQRSQTTPGGITHRYYVCGNSPRACKRVSIRADDADELVTQEFLELKGNEYVRRRVYEPGEDTSYELAEVEQTIEGLREDRALGLFTSPADQQTYREQMLTLVARRDGLSVRPIRPAGWSSVTTDETYAQAFETASPIDRRRMLVDAWVSFWLTSPTEWRVHIERAPESAVDSLSPVPSIEETDEAP